VRILRAALFCLILAGCASTVLERKALRSYSVGVVQTATVGEVFIVNQDGHIETVKNWVGILNSPDGWKIEKRYSTDFLRQELIYAGKSGSTIDISYREFRGGLAAPAFFQNLKYDLAESMTSRFRNFVINMRQADNQKLTYLIQQD
jgi:hypothetical protein